jgi:hypothetical protein
MDIYRTLSFTNPLGIFKLGRIVESGSWAREVAFNLLKARRFDQDSGGVWDLNPPEIAVNYHMQNRMDKYRVSVSEDQLQQAMVAQGMGGGGISRLIGEILSLPYTSDEHDEYMIMRNLITEYDIESNFFNVHVDDITPTNLTADQKRTIGLITSQRIRELVLRWRFFSTDYNHAGVPQTTSDPILIATPEFFSNMDVMVLSRAFNMNEARFMGRTVLVDKIPLADTNTKAQAILADEKWFVAADTLIRNTSIFNPDNITTNHWLHHWGIYSLSRFLNVALFSTRADTGSVIEVSTVNGITIKLVGTDIDKITPGFTYRLVAEVVGTGRFNASVRWKITETDKTPMSANTFIGPDGLLHVASDEEGTYFVIEAMSIQDDTVVGKFLVGPGTVGSELTVFLPDNNSSYGTVA